MAMIGKGKAKGGKHKMPDGTMMADADMKGKKAKKSKSKKYK
jgi:hypothetical protein